MDVHQWLWPKAIFIPSLLCAIHVTSNVAPRVKFDSSGVFCYADTLKQYVMKILFWAECFLFSC